MEEKMLKAKNGMVAMLFFGLLYVFFIALIVLCGVQLDAGGGTLPTIGMVIGLML